MSLDKRDLLDQLRRIYRQRLGNANRAETDAREAAQTFATESEKKEDARAALEFGALATGQGQRMRAAQEELIELERLLARDLPNFDGKSKVSLFAVVDALMIPEDGEAVGKTFFVLPVGAGTELTGPGGDGFLSVITPNSPVGKALMHKRVGENCEVTLREGVCELEVLEVA